MKILVALPFFGEFGWELHRWQGRVRLQSKNYDKTLIYCRSQAHYLYWDVAQKFSSPPIFDRIQMPYGWGSYDRKDAVDNIYNLIREQHKDDDTDFIEPSQELCESDADQEFIPYGIAGLSEDNFDVLIHAFKNPFEDSQNYDEDKWIRIVRKFPDINFASIGNPEDSIKIIGTKDRRDLDLRNTANILRNAKLAIGPATDLMHYASLCNCPKLIWSDEEQIKKRFEEWNPFQIKTTILNEKDPPEEAIIEYLESQKNALLAAVGPQ